MATTTVPEVNTNVPEVKKSPAGFAHAPTRFPR